MTDIDMIYVPQDEFTRLRRNAERSPAWGVWLSGFAAGFVAAVLLLRAVS